MVTKADLNSKTDLIERYKKKEAAINKEILRYKTMCRYEEESNKKGISLIAGIDEAGRGPLAGPVVAAAVILPFGIFIEGLNDYLERHGIHSVNDIIGSLHL